MTSQFSLRRGWLVAAAVVVLAGCSQERLNLSRAVWVRPGMTFKQVYAIMGEPAVGFGLPQDGSKETSDLYYEIPNNEYVVIHFVGDRVTRPVTSKEPRGVLVQ
jgi:hypothetical protein